MLIQKLSLHSTSCEMIMILTATVQVLLNSTEFKDHVLFDDLISPGPCLMQIIIKTLFVQLAMR